jgi:hypothetical protein
LKRNYIWGYANKKGLNATAIEVLLFTMPVGNEMSHEETTIRIREVTEMSTRSIIIIMFLGSKVRLVRRANKLTAIYEPIAWTMWDP